MRANKWVFCAVALFLAGAVHAASPYRAFSEQHSTAKKKLLNILSDPPKFNDDFCAAAEEEPEAMREYIEFLAGKGDRNTNDFVEKKGREAKLIRRVHEKFPERVRAFREWIRDYNDAALDLARIPDGVKWICKGGEVPLDRRDDRKDAHDNREGDKKKKKDKD
jgi:hypothetical protein